MQQHRPLKSLRSQGCRWADAWCGNVVRQHVVTMQLQISVQARVARHGDLGAADDARMACCMLDAARCRMAACIRTVHNAYANACK